MEYHHQQVDISIAKDTDLYRRIEAKAAADGVTVERLVSTLVMLGSYRLDQVMAAELDELEKRK